MLPLKKTWLGHTIQRLALLRSARIVFAVFAAGASRVGFAFAIVILSTTLCTDVSAQPKTAAPQASPAVDTGGPEGGPTGLFSIYDGQTLRKGEFSFSVAFSNYDRDPGKLDIIDWPAGPNVGLSNHLESFFNANAYRGIKVNNPQNVSSFYLRNTQGFFSRTLLGSGPVVILAPQGSNVGTLAGTAVFRPPFCPACAPTGVLNVYYNAGQPSVVYPFTGGADPNLGPGPGVISGLFGFPGFGATLEPPSGGSSNFGDAGRFPGVGSAVGSVLPGIVPITYATAPSYLPDAPFVSRLYGESSLTNFMASGKIRLMNPRSALGFGLIPFYRWYLEGGLYTPAPGH